MPSEAERKRKEKWYRDQALRHGQTVGSVPGVTGGGWVPNTSAMGAINGNPFVWNPPATGAGTPPAAAPPSPSNAGAPPATTPPAGAAPTWTGPTYLPPWAPGSGLAGLQTGAPLPSTPAATPPSASEQGNTGGQGGGELGPGANGFYSQKEFWDTLAGYSDGNWHGEGWYGSNGNWSPTLQGLQNQGDWAGDGTDRAIGYNPTYGMNTVGGGASSGANYQGGRRGRSGWLEGLGIDPYQNMLGNQEVRRQIRAQFPSKRGGGHTPPAGLIGNQSRAQGGGGGTTPNWMGTMVGFNP